VFYESRSDGACPVVGHVGIDVDHSEGMSKLRTVTCPYWSRCPEKPSQLDGHCSKTSMVLVCYGIKSKSAESMMIGDRNMIRM